jgi:hypothetical protein
MAQRRAFLPALWAFALATSAGEQTGHASEPSLPLSPASPEVSPPTGDPPIPHPTFAVLSASGEAGANYAVGAKVAVLANPFSSGISLGGSVFFAPLTGFENQCAQPCNQNPVLFRGMAELRLGTAYREHVRGLFWFGLSAGVAYFAEPHIDPGPSLAVAVGGDVRLARSLWLELSPRATWAQIIGPATSFGGTYFTFGVEVGMRFDLAH